MNAPATFIVVGGMHFDKTRSLELVGELADWVIANMEAFRALEHERARIGDGALCSFATHTIYLSGTHLWTLCALPLVYPQDPTNLVLPDKVGTWSWEESCEIRRGMIIARDTCRVLDNRGLGSVPQILADGLHSPTMCFTNVVSWMATVIEMIYGKGPEPI